MAPHIEKKENLNCFPERDELLLLLPPPLARPYAAAAVLAMQEEYYHLSILLNQGRQSRGGWGGRNPP